MSILQNIRKSLLRFKCPKEPFLDTLLGYRTKNPTIFQQALRHRSVSGKSNERLEYLGDAVISLAVADVLYELYPKEGEGFLTRARSKIVCREHLNKVAKDLHLDAYLQISHPTRKKQPVNLLGNGLEALVGAIYMDAGYDRAAAFVKQHILGDKRHIVRSAQTEIDFKSRLLEWGQAHKQTIEFVYEGDEFNAPTDRHKFSFAVVLDGKPIAHGKGKNKMQAQQHAAKGALNSLHVLHESQ